MIDLKKYMEKISQLHGFMYPMETMKILTDLYKEAYEEGRRSK